MNYSFQGIRVFLRILVVTCVLSSLCSLTWAQTDAKDAQKQPEPSQPGVAEPKKEETAPLVPPSQAQGPTTTSAPVSSVPATIATPAQTVSAAAPAQSASVPEQTVVRKVEIRGNRVVSTNAVINKLKTKVGHPLLQEVVNEDVKRLYATGFFQDVRVDVQPQPDGLAVTIVVDEKPIIKRIIIEGFKTLKEDAIRKDLGLVEGQILDEKAVKETVNKIQNKYIQKGFRFAEVKSDVDVNQETKDAVLYILIDEGGKYKIKNVKFSGNKTFPPKRLARLVKTKPEFIFLLRKGVFDEEKFQEDIDRVHAFYQAEGFLDAQVAPEYEYDRKNQKIFITIKVEENSRYYTGDVKIKGNVLFPESEIWENLAMLPGFVFSQAHMTQDVEAIRKYYYKQGYIGVQITPDVVLNPDTKKVDVVYSIVEGDLFFIDKIKIRGNTKTKDIVIRRELRAHPGERFDGDKLDRSKQRLDNLGFFSEVMYDTEEGSAPNRRNLIFNVKEKQTGELSFGAGISSIDKFVGFAEISQKNFDWLNFPTFTGAGESLSIRGRLGQITRDLDISFVEPYFLGKNLSLGLDGYNVKRDKNNTNFDETRTGISISFAKALSEYIKAGIGLTGEQVKLSDVPSTAGPDVLAFKGNTNLGRVKFTISRDSRDSIFNPGHGSVIAGTAEFIGGDETYYNGQLSFSKYLTFFKKQILEVKTRLGVTDTIGGDKVPVFDRFYAGGLGTVRGYGPRKIGPQQNGGAVGGDSLFVLNLEYTVPIIESFKGAVFMDFGNVASGAYALDGGEFAVSIGPGLKINTPIGPVALYYGFPVMNPDEENKNGRFEFSFSRGF
ncbi:MAG: outer membrane protein assembly factor BamA [Candidatus Omnitrophica bacterium]|nr:outer membrane protein assembly factor BamA [Candidatus Omnitrophota bacterium]